EQRDRDARPSGRERADLLKAEPGVEREGPRVGRVEVDLARHVPQPEPLGVREHLGVEGRADPARAQVLGDDDPVDVERARAMGREPSVVLARIVRARGEREQERGRLAASVLDRERELAPRHVLAQAPEAERVDARDRAVVERSESRQVRLAHATHRGAQRSTAPSCSPAAATIRARTSATSSAVRVRSAARSRTASATDFLPSPTCGPVKTSNSRTSSASSPAASRTTRRSAAAVTVSATMNAKSSFAGGKDETGTASTGSRGAAARSA